jgi:hypothetical protein
MIKEGFAADDTTEVSQVLTDQWIPCVRVFFEFLEVRFGVILGGKGDDLFGGDRDFPDRCSPMVSAFMISSRRSAGNSPASSTAPSRFRRSVRISTTSVSASIHAWVISMPNRPSVAFATEPPTQMASENFGEPVQWPCPVPGDLFGALDAEVRERLFPVCQVNKGDNEKPEQRAGPDRCERGFLEHRLDQCCQSWFGDDTQGDARCRDPDLTGR